MHVLQYISCINKSFPNNETTKHSLQAYQVQNLSMKIEKTENWK